MHICMSLPYLEKGGTEGHVLTLIRRFALEHRVTLLAPSGPREELKDLPARHVRFERLDRSFAQGWKTYRQALRTLVETDAPEMLHVHGAHELLLIAPRPARRLPAVFTAHGYHGAGRGVSYRTSAWVTNRFADQVIAVSGHEERVMIEHGCRRATLNLVHNGIDDPHRDRAEAGVPHPDDRHEEGRPVDDAQASRANAGASRGREGGQDGMGPTGRAPDGEDQRLQGKFVIGTVARLEEAKGIEWLIRAVGRIHAQAIAGIHCMIVGTGSLEGELKALAQSLGVAGMVDFAGYVPNASHIMGSFELFVLPALEEPFGLVCAEAMANGLPVVATQVGGIPESVVHGETGLLVQARREDLLADAILALYRDRDLARRMGQAGRGRFLQNFTSEVMAAKTLRVYERAIARHKEEAR